MLFSEIENAVINEDVDAGLIIHENRFTYQQKGLKKIIDLGEYWESLIHAPIPLGGIVIKRNFSDELKQKIDRIIKKSVQYAFAHPEEVMPFIKQHAQEMDPKVMQQHIQLYVNDYSVDLGNTGREAVILMMQKAQELNLVNQINQDLFVYQN